MKYPFYEFFAGGGLARIGLGENWECLFANDISAMKGAAYRQNFSKAAELLIDDIQGVKTSDLPDKAILAWASFPCQDLSLAGNGGGIHAERSGTFWSFWRLMQQLQEERRGVPIIVIENVVGLLSSAKGNDFLALAQAVADAGYRLGALVINADQFVPQSRPRLFLIAVDQKWRIPDSLTQAAPIGGWFPKPLLKAFEQLPSNVRSRWIWWNLPAPQSSPKPLKALIEPDPTGVEWHTTEETDRLLSLMSEVNLKKIHDAQATGSLQVGTVYKRTRRVNGKGVQRAEIRFDGKSGCLRTPAGGSSRQIVVVVEGKSIRSRLLSPREAARLMGLDDSYILPDRYNQSYHIMGDAVVVPVISWLERHILHSLVIAQPTTTHESGQPCLEPQLSPVASQMKENSPLPTTLMP